MNANTVIKSVVLVVGFTALALFFNDLVNSVVVDGSSAIVEQSNGPQYAPGEILVKFKEGVDPRNILRSAGIESKEIRRIHTIKPAVTRYKKDHPEAAAMTDEEVFAAAYNDLPEVEKSLYRSCEVTLSEGMNVEEAVTKLKQNPHIEYAEPNRSAHIM
ncbi:MAG: hypothetical protein PHT32_03180 [Candidatus Omnitrophica bacterium]|nr:hypothetical protein [Candidatus Omnitrophota bacterium]